MKNLAKASFLVSNSDRGFVNSNVRNAVLCAYDYTCQHCEGKSGLPATAVDHIIPLNPEARDLTGIAELDLSMFSETLDCLENMTAACKPCNSSKSNKIICPNKIKELLAKAKTRHQSISLLINPLKHAAIQSDDNAIGRVTLASSFILSSVNGDVLNIEDKLPLISDKTVLEKAIYAAAIMGQFNSFVLLAEHLKGNPILSKAVQDIKKIDVADLTANHFRIIDYKLAIVPSTINSYRYPSCRAINLTTPLKMGRTDIFESLIEDFPGYLDLKNGVDRKLVLCSASNDFGGVIKALDMGANVRTCSNLPIKLANSSRNTDIASLLIANGADYSVDDYETLSIAISNGDIALIDQILTLGVPHEVINNALSQTLLNAPKTSFEELLSKFVLLGASLTDQNVSAFNKICIEPLRTYGRGKNYNSWPRVMERDRYIDIVKTLLPIGGYQHVQSALEEVIAKSSAPECAANATFRLDNYELQVVKTLIEAGGDILATRDNGYLWACAFGEADIIKNYMDVFSTNSNVIKWHKGFNFAQKNNHKKVLDLLFANGVSDKVKRKAPAQSTITIISV